MLNETTNKVDTSALDGLLRLISFTCLSLVAMGAIGLSVLADPLTQYFQDQALIQNQKALVADLEDLREQQDRLLANANHPSVIERVAINQLNYQTLDEAGAEQIALADSWPDLQRAIALADNKSTSQATVGYSYLNFIQTLSTQPLSKDLLMLFGSVLVVICLTFFHRPRPTFATGKQTNL